MLETEAEVTTKSTPEFSDNKYIDLTARGINRDTCVKFGYSVANYGGKTVQVAPYYDINGNVVGRKVRFPDKTFMFTGDAKSSVLWGQQLWRDGGKMIVITEGEIDAMSVSQMQDNKWPVVSIRSGAAGAVKDIKSQVSWLEKFETVVFMFDNDDPGREAAQKCAAVLTPGKAKIASLPLKDPNEMLKAGRGPEIINAIWGAKTYRPDGIIDGRELWQKVLEEDKNDSKPYPWLGLQNILCGIRKSEITCFTAGSGIGKSAVVREIAKFLHDTGETVGYIALEESVKRTALLFCGLELNKRVHIDRTCVTEAELRAAFDATVGSGRMYLYDHFGSIESDNLLEKIRYLAISCGCSTIVLDHVSIVVSGIDDGDERRILDNLMTDLRSLAQELNVRLLIVSHLKRPNGKGHEEGARTELAQLRGSHSIAQLSDAVIGLERDQQGDLREYTRLRVLKNRFTGETGPACWLWYDRDTGRLQEKEPPSNLVEGFDPTEDSDF